MSGEIKSGWNLPPGVFDNNPHFNGDEPDVDVDEMNGHLTRIDEIIGEVDVAADWAVKNDIISDKDYEDVMTELWSLYSEIRYKKNQLTDEGWNI